MEERKMGEGDERKGMEGPIRKKPKRIGVGKRPRFKWPFWVCVDSTRQQSPYERLSRKKQLGGGVILYQDDGGAGRPDRDDR